MYFTVYWWYSHGSPWTHGILSICASMVIPLCFAGFCGSHFLWVFRYFSYARLAIVLPSSWSTILLLWPKRDLWAASWRKVDMQMIAILRPPKGPKTNGLGGLFFPTEMTCKKRWVFTEGQPRCFLNLQGFLSSQDGIIMSFLDAVDVQKRAWKLCQAERNGAGAGCDMSEEICKTHCFTVRIL